MAAQKGPYTAFVKWDDKKAGGRYFECNYEKAAINATNCFDVVCHDGDSGMYHAANVFPIKPFGDGRGPCIAYYDDRAYAFKGRVEQYGHGRYYVIFDDGDKKWVAQDKVYKYEDLPQYSFWQQKYV